MALDATGDPRRPGLFQTSITGVGGVSVYKNFVLLGSLEQNCLVVDYHDVLWKGPVHQRLKQNLHATLVENHVGCTGSAAPAHLSPLQDELLVRWQNAICRTLYNIQQYGHGGGLLIVPSCPAADVNVKYEQTYRRMPSALFRLAQHQIVKRQTADTIAIHCQTPGDTLPRSVHFNTVQHQRELDGLKKELLGCVRFIASLSRVDGFVLLDKCLVVHGVGVEARAESDVADVHIAGDVRATLRRLRQVPISQFGTRHRAMIRYCHQHAGALGFVISQDGDIRAVMQQDGQVILWENINVQLAYRPEDLRSLGNDISSTTMTGLVQYWLHSADSIRTA